MRPACRVCLLLVPLLAVAVLAKAESAGTSEAKAPALRYSQTAEKRDLGVWDDAFVCKDQEVVVLRRGETFFALSLSSSAGLKELVTAPAARTRQIIDCVGSGDRLWLLLQSDKVAPAAIDARSGKAAHFNIPGLKAHGFRAPVISSHILIRHADAVMLEISGGDPRDPETWPRTDRRPLYFWMSLESGKVIAFPVGWDLQYFSADQQIAVFMKPPQGMYGRPLQAVDVRTGDLTAAIPDRRITGVVLFDRWEAQDVRPIYERHTEAGNSEYFSGLSVNGSVFLSPVSPFTLKLSEGYYLSAAKVIDDFAGFRQRHGYSDPSKPSSFLVMQLKPLRDPQLMATEVVDFAMLDRGNYVFVTKSSEAFWGSALEKTTWSVLDGVTPLSGVQNGRGNETLEDYELELQVKMLIDQRYTEGSLHTWLIDGFGNHDSLALCVFFNFSPSFFNLPRYKPWRSTILVTSAGERYMTDLLREGEPPDLIWLHNSGRVIMGKYLWDSLESTGERRVHLSEATLRLQP